MPTAPDMHKIPHLRSRPATMAAMSTPSRTLRWTGLVIVLLLSNAAQADIERRNAITQAVEKCRESIVNLRTLRVVPARFDNVDSGRVRGLGTGVLIDPRGYLVTNYHVVEDVDEIEARLADGRHFPASIIETDRRNDLAILKVNTADILPALSLVGAGDGILGETVIAIGNPYGLEDSVTIGIVSAVNRELKLPNGEVFQGLIQTDASINPGNSGGPLVTINGDLLGVNVAIRSNAQGIAFAIPTGRVREIIAGMMRGAGDIAQSGFNVEENPIQKVGGVPTPPTGIVRVSHVEPDSSADRAGLKPGDELMAVSGENIDMKFDLERAFWDRRDGEVLTVKIRREGLEQTLNLPVGTHRGEDSFAWDYLGIRPRPVTDVVKRVQPRWEGGLLILEVRPGSPAMQAGIRAGDILCGLHDRSLLEARHIKSVTRMNDFLASQPVRFHVIREAKVIQGRIQLSAP
jgi:serine protease Do